MPVVRYLGVPGNYIVLLVAVMQSELVLEVGREVHPEVVVCRVSGVRQGDPLSPAIFPILMLAPHYDIQRLHVQLEVLWYADDILLMFKATGQKTKSNVRAVLYVLSVF